MATAPICAIAGCGKKGSLRRGMCGAHYKKWRIYGDPLAGHTREHPYGYLKTWLDENSSNQSDECILWPFGKSEKTGYGLFTVNGRPMMPHQYMCTAVHGDKPSTDHEVAHCCGVRHCVAPRHLRWATKAENAADRLLHGTDPRGEKNGHAKLREKDVYEIRRLRGIETGVALADRFGVSPSQITNIQLGKQWAYHSAT